MKAYNGLSILYAALMLGAVLVSPTFADQEKVDKVELDRTNTSVAEKSAKDQIVDMKTLDDTELAGTNFSMSGTSIKKPSNCVEKNGICEEIKQDRITSDKVTAVSSPLEIKMIEEIREKSVMIGGDTAFRFGMGGSNVIDRVGNVTVTPLR